MICQAFQARGIVRYEWQGMIKPLIEELVKRDVNIVQMPCPESQFGGYVNGLKREPKGIDKYDTPIFRELCNRLASDTANLIVAVLASGYQVLAILGMEHSPSCAVNYQYTSKGTVNRPGLFIEALRGLLKKENIEIPLIGVNRKAVGKSLIVLNDLFAANKQAGLNSFKT